MPNEEIQRPKSKVQRPANAELVFKGEIFDVYHWQQELYNGKTARFEQLKRADTVLVIPVTDDGHILLTKEEQPSKPPFMSFPGGRVEEGEAPLLAAARELKEETGYEARELVLFDAVQPYSKIDWAIFTFIAKGCRKTTEQNLDAGEKIECTLLSWEEFLDLPFNPELNDPSITTAILKARLNPEEEAKLKRLLLG